MKVGVYARLLQTFICTCVCVHAHAGLCLYLCYFKSMSKQSPKNRAVKIMGGSTDADTIDAIKYVFNTNLILNVYVFLLITFDLCSLYVHVASLPAILYFFPPR